MGLIMIATHYNNDGNIIGIRILDTDSGEKKDVSYDSALSVATKHPGIIENIEVKDGNLSGYNGALGRYAKIKNGKLVGRSPLVVIEQLGDIGYKVSDWNGTVKNYRNDDVIRYSSDNGIANGKLVERDGKQYISAIVGNYRVIEIDEPKEKKVNNIENKENAQLVADATKEQAKAVVNPVEVVPIDFPVINRPERPRVITGVEAKGDRRREVDEKTGMTVEQKMLQALLVMRSSKSFYYAMLNAMDRVESEEIQTMGVSTDKIFFNVDFVKELSMPELVYVLHHEVCHVAMRHRVRGEGKRHELWNIACDAYINKHLEVEFSMKNDNKVYKYYDEKNPFIKAMLERRGINYPTQNDLRYDMMDIGLQSPKDGIFIDDIDIDVDTPEGLYEEMLKNIKEPEGKSGSQGQQGDGDGQGQSGAGSGESDGEQDSSEQDGGGESKDKGSGADGKESDAKGSEEKSGKGKGEVETNLRGKKIVVKPNSGDMVDTQKEATASREQLGASTKITLSRASVTHKQIGGEAGSSLQRIVRDALAPVINWRALLRKKLIAEGQKINTYSKPDKRFISRGMILPGPKVLDPNKLKGVKICIDTSGSIRDEELGIALKQIQNLLKTYQAEAEVIYWDTQVRNKAEFKTVDELLKIKPMGGGGTDVNCVFEYFNSRECVVKPTISLIFTDGGFGPVSEKYYKKYRDTVWILQKGISFDAPFGVVAPFKKED